MKIGRHKYPRVRDDRGHSRRRLLAEEGLLVEEELLAEEELLLEERSVVEGGLLDQRCHRENDEQTGSSKGWREQERLCRGGERKVSTDKSISKCLGRRRTRFQRMRSFLSG